MSKLDLTTTYLGLPLSNPFVVGAGPLSTRADQLPLLEEHGAAAVVLPSLFEEQIEHEEWQSFGLDQYASGMFAEAETFFPDFDNPLIGGDAYLHNLYASKQSVSIPVIASLNGSSTGGWVRYAKRMEDSGADALELNVFTLPTDPDLTSADVEDQYLELIAAVCEQVKIPVAVKIGPYFSALPNFARRISLAGAKGVVLFNRFLQPDFSLETLQIEPSLDLSTPAELRLPLRWVGILRPNLMISIGASTGVHSGADALKLLLAGADATLLVSVLLQNGVKMLRHIRHEVENWMREHEYESIEQLKGSMSLANCPDPGGYERANYLRNLTAYTRLWSD